MAGGWSMSEIHISKGIDWLRVHFGTETILEYICHVLHLMMISHVTLNCSMVDLPLSSWTGIFQCQPEGKLQNQPELVAPKAEFY